MNIDLPNHLESTCQLLHRSLGLRSSEVAPAIPQGLVHDLQQRFAPTQSIVVESKSHSAGVFQSFFRLFSTPAIGATAIIVGVMSFAIPALLPSDQTETFRGTNPTEARIIPIFVSGGPTEIRDILASSGDFESGSVVRIESLAAAMDQGGAMVIVDFDEGAVLSIDGEGRTVAREELPENLGLLSLKVAQAVSRL